MRKNGHFKGFQSLKVNFYVHLQEVSKISGPGHKTRQAFTFSASSPAWMTGPNTVSVSLVSANISGIWSSKLEKQAASN